MAEDLIRLEVTHYDEKTESVTVSLRVFEKSKAIEKISSALLMSDLSTMDNKEIADVALKALLGE